MKFDLRRPCANCPWRNDRPFYLRAGRRQEIAGSLRAGAPFACHKTTEFVDDDDGGDLAAVATSQMCAGATIAMMHEGEPNQTLRFAHRLGMFDPDLLDMGSPVVRSLDEFVEAGDDFEGD